MLSSKYFVGRVVYKDTHWVYFYVAHSFVGVLKEASADGYKVFGNEIQIGTNTRVSSCAYPDASWDNLPNVKNYVFVHGSWVDKAYIVVKTSGRFFNKIKRHLIMEEL